MPTYETRVTKYEYNGDGRVKKLKAQNSVTGEQVTEWVYGTTVGSGVAESDVASFDLVRQKIYPDGVGGNNVVSYGYNRQGELKGMSDQNGTVHEYDYDGLGRFVDDRVTTVGGGIDGYVKRISRSYDTRGQLATVNSYDNATVGIGTLRSQVKRDYNDFGQLAREYQVHGATSITPGSPHVDYGYADGSENSVRRESVTYPNGRAITYDYGTTGSIDRMAGRVAQIKDDGVARVNYTRRGSFSTESW